MTSNAETSEELLWGGSPAIRMAIFTPFTHATIILCFLIFYPAIKDEVTTLVKTILSTESTLTAYAPGVLFVLLMIPSLWNFIYQTSTNYFCTSERLIIKKGIMVRTEDEIELYRVIDVVASANLFQRLMGVGTIYVKSTDQTGNVKITSISDASSVRNTIRTSAEICKTRKGTLRVLNENGAAL